MGIGIVIFVTVGSQMPFDRLVQAMDEYAATTSVQVFAQIGNTNFRPKAMQWATLLDPAAYRRLFSDSSLVISHAGMGTIISAAEAGKPLVVMPRRGHLKETRNDHQVATAKWLSGRAGIYVAEEAEDLKQLVSRIEQSACPPAAIPKSAPEEFIAAIRAFIAP